MKTKSQKQKTKRKPKPKGETFPLEVQRGNAIVKVYRTISAKGYTSYQVPSWDTGERVLRTFSDLAEAKKEAEGIGDKMNTGEGLALSNADGASYQRAVEILEPTGAKLEVAASVYAEAFKLVGDHVLEAARFFAKKNLVKLPTRTVRQVVDELIAMKEAAKKDKDEDSRYVSDLNYRLGKFAEEFSCPIANVTGNEIQSFLDDLELSPQSYENFKRVIGTMFKFAVRRGYLPKDFDEMDRIEKADTRGRKAPDIYKPEEMARLLAAASPDFLPCLAIAGFAGLRSAEVERLDWSEVRLADKFIEITARKAKTKSRRLVPITDNLAAWLAPHARKCGSVWSGLHDKYYDAQQETAAATKTEEAEALEWKHNGLRHSFITYRLADLQNENQVAMEAGNSPSMIHSHYKALQGMRPADAKKWFGISPTTPVNMVSMNQPPVEKAS